MNRGVIAMSQKELQRLPVLEAVLKKQTTQVEAAACLELSSRQVRRLERRLEAEGPRGLVHRSRGQSSNHAKPQKLRRQVLELIRQKYPDFGPTLASEKLAERHKIVLSDETVRQWMRAEGLLAGRRRPRPHRRWREPSACYGQMVQMDGSHHDWLEGRGPWLVLMGYIDDATNKAYARFFDSEDLPAALDSFKRYCRLYGIPQSVYLDKHTIYRSPKEPTVEEQLQGKDPQSQFERALAELGVQVIHADSPQAKGRIERLFKTLQDRLVKEMRLAGIKTLEEANRFLKGFLAWFNRRFSRAARQPGNLHRPVPAGKVLSQALCIKEPRVVANDGTIRIDGQRLQLLPSGLRPLAKKGVTVTISPQGRMEVLYEGKELAYRPVPVRSVAKPQAAGWQSGHGYPQMARKPAANHPWRHKNWFARVKTSKPTQELKSLETLKA